MIVKWNKQMDSFIIKRQFQNINKTLVEFQQKFNVFIKKNELEGRYRHIYGKKNKNVKLKVRSDSFLARGIRYRYTVTQYCGGYVGTLRKSPYTMHFAPDRILLRVELRDIMMRHLKDMDLLLDGKLCPKIRIDWVDTNMTMKQIARKYGVTRDTVYGVIMGDIHPDPQYLRYEMKRVRRIRHLTIEVFEGEAPRGYKEWAADPRSNASWSMIYRRYRKGMRGPDLLKESSNKSDERYYLIEGEYKTIREWSQDPRCEVTYNCLRKRVRNEWSLELKILKKSGYIKRFSYKDKDKIAPQRIIRKNSKVILWGNKEMPKID